VVKITWKFFVGSCILAAGLLFKAGAPVAPVALGIAAAAVLTWRRQRAAGNPKP
jgi:hypothetical protein